MGTPREEAWTARAMLGARRAVAAGCVLVLVALTTVLTPGCGASVDAPSTPTDTATVTATSADGTNDGLDGGEQSSVDAAGDAPSDKDSSFEDAAADTEANKPACPGSPGCACDSDAVCDDGDPCTIDGACEGGACQGKTAKTCDDGVDCTSDGCDATQGCVFTARSGACQDGDPCTVGDTCESGACVKGKPAVCNDGNTCTDDTCTTGVGCTFSHNTAECIAANACTFAGTCDFGTCVAGKLKPCADNNACTFSVCDPTTGCAHVNLPNATTCTGGAVSDGRCYRAFTGKKPADYLTARAACEGWGGVLAGVFSKEANATARAQATAVCGAKSGAWIGLNDRMREGVWRWGDGSRTVFQNWGKGEPNNAGNEDAVHMRADGRWNDVSDEPKKSLTSCWLCSRPMPTPCKPSGAACLTGATCSAGSCDAAAATPASCDDHNGCTADSCAKGACKHVALPDQATCTGGTCGGGVCAATETPPAATSDLPPSCRAIWQADPKAESGVRWLLPPGLPAPVSAHCDQGDGGGWTLVLKTRGKNPDFGYNGAHWQANPSNAVSDAGPAPGEALLPTYGSVPLTEVRVVMQRKGQRRSVRIQVSGGATGGSSGTKPAPSLRALITAKKPVLSHAGLAAWKQLLIDASLQKSCHSEGLNIASSYDLKRVRIGIIGNQENDCASPDSWIGVGGLESVCGGVKKGIFAGNIACYGGDKGNRFTAADTWVYVR